MSEASSLSRGVIYKLWSGTSGLPAPTLQVMNVREIANERTTRYRIVLSDGEHYMQAMWSRGQGVPMADWLNKNTVIILAEYHVNDLGGRKIILISNAVKVRQASSTIGAPRMLGEDSSPSKSRDTSSRSSSGRGSTSGSMSSSRMRSAGMAGGGGGISEEYQPVKTLNPYQQSWRIKVRCTAKDAMREYSNAKGPGQVFGVDLLDEHGTEIRASCFGEAASKWYPVFEKGGIFFISKGKVVMSRKQYTHIKNDYALTLYESSEVTRGSDDDDSSAAKIKKVKYDFQPIGELESRTEGSYVDIIACVTDVAPLTQIQTKRGSMMDKRELTVCDKSGSVRVTLWNEMARKHDETTFHEQIILLKGCKVGSFGGRSLSAGSTMEVSPLDNDKVAPLRRWAESKRWDFSDIPAQTTRGGGPGSGSAQAGRMSIDEGMKKAEDDLHMSDDQQVYFELAAWISTISHSRDKPPLYMAAPGGESKAKVVDDGSGKYYCAKLSKTFDTYEPRYVLRFLANDHSGQQWLSAFHDEAVKIVGRSAKEVEELSHNDDGRFEKVFNDASFKPWKLKVRAKNDTYQDETRIRYQVYDANPLDLEDDCRYLEEQIALLEAL